MSGHRYFRKHLTLEQTQQLLAHIDGSFLASDVPLGEKVEHECAIVFFDLCNFTNISWGLSTDRVLAILQELFTFVAKTVTKYKGMIDKYPGDGVVAFFPRVYSSPERQHIEQALDCTLEVMHWFYDKMRWHHKLPKSSHSLELAVGLDAGSISIAHVGSPVHSELILLGDQVNCASKCQQAAEKREVIIGQEAAEQSRPLYRSHFSQGPSTGIVYTRTQSQYLSFRFDWEAMLKSGASWIDKDAR